MCYRYYFSRDEIRLRAYYYTAASSKLAELFRETGKELKSSGEILPMDTAPVLAVDRNGVERCFPMRFGYLMDKGKPMLNSRSETAMTKPMFRESWLIRRCAVPCTGYIEWDHYTDSRGKLRTGDKHLITSPDEEITFLLGLYRMEEGLPCFTVLTEAPSKDIVQIHDRMPVILPEKHISEWLDKNNDPSEIIRNAVTSHRVGLFSETAVI